MKKAIDQRRIAVVRLFGFVVGKLAAISLLGFSLVAIAGLPTLVTPALPAATTGTPYTAKLLLGGVPAPTLVTLVGLPSGLTATHNGSGSVAISGTPVNSDGGILVNVTATNSVGVLDTTIVLTVLPAAGLVNNATAIVVGQTHACALVNGGVQCWGRNTNGNLGDGTNADSAAPVQTIVAGSGVTAIGTHGSSTCALVKGAVRCWGSNSGGQLGDGTLVQKFIPTQVLGLESGVTSLSVGFAHACAIAGNTLKCWGSNEYGQLGDGTTTSRTSPITITAFGANLTAVAAGSSHTCAIIDGGAKCVGAGFSGQLGNGSFATNSLVPVQAIAAGSGVTAMAGANHTCAVVNGGVRCWGANDLGEVGDTTTNARAVAFQTIPSGSNVTGLSVGGRNTCAVANGGLRCWGSNNQGQLGNGTLENKSSPIQTFANNTGVTAVATGDGITCALANGAISCMGSALYGQLGDGIDSGSTVARLSINSGSSVTTVSAGHSSSCAVIAGGVQCWGNNASATLGNGTKISSANPVQTIAAGSGVTSVAVRFLHGCAVANGGILCWGENGEGAVGSGAQSSRLSPVQTIAANSGATSVAVGTGHTCAVINGGLFCWGRNDAGQIGNGTTTNALTPVQIITPNSGVTAVAAGNQHTCAIVTGGVRCWGTNSLGELGDGSSLSRLTPAQILPPSTVATSIAAGASSTCVAAGGGVQCWGWNASGQLGDGTKSNRFAPVASVPSGSDVTGVAAGTFHSCAIKNSGIQCWGADEVLGGGNSILGTAAASSIRLDSGASGASAGTLHSCAVVNTGIVCWGKNDNFQLGDQSIEIGRKVTPRLIVSILPQTIIYATQPPQSVTFGAAPVTLNATGGDSGNAVVFSTTSPGSVCTVLANQVTFTGAGTCNISANQTGNLNYAAAPSVNTSVFINQIPQAVMYTAPPPFSVVFGAPSATLAATGGASGNPVTFATTTAASVCTVTGNVVQFTGAGVCDVLANQAGSTNYSAAPTLTITIAIAKAAQALAFAPTLPVTLAFGSLPIMLAASNGASGSPVVFATTSAATVCTVTGAQLRIVGLGNCVVTADQAGNNNYNAAPQVTAAIAIGQATQTITFNPTPPATAVVGGALISLTANGGSSGNAVRFLTTSAATICTIVGTQMRTVGVGACIITANQAGNTNFSAATPISATIIVMQGTQSITPSNNGAIAAGSATTLGASGGLSGNPITYTSSTPAICRIVTLAAGTNAVGVSTGTCVILLNQAGNANYAAAAQVSQNLTVLGIETAATNRYRIFIPSTGGHLFTTDKDEYDALIRFPGTYVDEGIDHKIFKQSLTLSNQSAVPYYRLFIVGIRQHFWTTDANEYNVLRAQTKVISDDGIDGYVFLNAGIAGTVPLYRLVLINTAVHHWTVDKNEFDFLVNSGSWLPEGAPGNPSGVTGYVLPK